MKQAELIPAQGEIVQAPTPTPMALIQVAMTQGAGIETLERLMALQERWQANEARQAFSEAMAAFKADPIVISKDKHNNQYNSKYTSLGTLVTTVTPVLSKHGLSASWGIDQTDGIRVSCTISHRLGYSSKPVTVKFPADNSGKKNPLQEIKSAITYAKACTFESACGLASTDANLDDDGNGGGGRVDDLQERLEYIANCRNLAELQTVYVAAYKAAASAKDKMAMDKIIAAKELRKRELAA